MLNVTIVYMNQTHLKISKRYLNLAWKNMEARDLMKTSKRRRSAAEMNEITSSTGMVTPTNPPMASTSQEHSEPTFSGGPYLVPNYLPSFGIQFSNFYQTASYSTKTWSVPGNDSQPGSQLNEHSDKQKWVTVNSKEERRHYNYEKNHPRSDHPRNFKSHKSQHLGHKNRTDPFGFSTLPRRWEYTESGTRYERDGLKPGKAGLPFSIMSYNVLSQNLLENHMYLYNTCQPEALDWDMRSEKLLAEIQLYNPDIICLQEVQSDHYQSFFKNKLFKLGYGSEFIKRSGDKPDGCATFYKMSKFSLVQSTPIEFCKGDILDRDNVALILELSPNTKVYHGSVKKIGVANTHLLYNPKRGDVKLAQLMVLLAELDRILHRNSNDQHPGYFPLLLCGDFNSEPRGDLYKFLTTGFLNYEGRFARNLSGQYDGTHGRNYQMKKHFFSSRFGITDQCQYVKNVLQRQGTETQSTEKCVTHLTSEKGSSQPELIQETITNHVMSEGIIFSNQNLGELSSKQHCCQEIAGNLVGQDSVPQDSVTSGLIANLFSQDDQTLQNMQVADITQATVQNSSVSEKNTSVSEKNTSVLSVPQTGQTSENWDAEIQENSRSHFSQSSGRLWHNFNLISAYKHRIQRFGFREYEVTSQHNQEACCVDYIFYSGSRGNRQGHQSYREGKLKLLARYGLMSSKELYGMGGLPNKIHPSDHLCLMSKFLLR